MGCARDAESGEARDEKGKRKEVEYRVKGEEGEIKES